MGEARLAVDIGGTFTDLVLETPSGTHEMKLLTTPDAPERAVLEGARAILAAAGCAPGEVALVVHGTTLATNALIERRGAPTALLTTEGFRDSVEMAYEHRFEQYDLSMQRPQPLVPRDLRLGVPERIAADGSVLLPLDEDALRATAATLRARAASRRWRSASCIPSPTRRMNAAPAPSWRRSCPAPPSPCPARWRPRSANTNAPPPPSPTPMCCR